MDRPIKNQTSLDLQSAGTDPAVLFEQWFEEACQADRRNAAVVALATASIEAVPSLRMVLLKEHGPDGFVFYTDYRSRKAAELKDNPAAAMTFWWPEPERQVRIEGRVEKLSPKKSDAYFSTRPRESQLSAWVYAQSSVIEQAAAIDDVRRRFEGREVPRPDTWGGYRLIPISFEFWQGRDNRLHDRIRFTQLETGWRAERLAP